MKLRRHGKKENREKKEKVRAFGKEVRTHKWFLYVLTALAFLVLVYEASTGSLSLQLFAGVVFALVLVAFIGDLIHRRNVKMLKMVLAVFIVTLLASAFAQVPAAHAYTFSNGAVTSSNGAITVPIPYVTPPSTNFASTTFIGPIPLVAVADFNTNPLAWFEDILVNLLLDVANAMIYAANIIIGFVVAIVAAVISIPVFLFDAISITTLGPVVDFLSFIPASYAWLATGAVWAISLTEWVVIIIALVRLMRVAIQSGSEVLGQEEESVKEDTGALA